jgi:hypothetical protein
VVTRRGWHAAPTRRSSACHRVIGRGMRTEEEEEYHRIVAEDLARPPGWTVTLGDNAWVQES